MSDRAQLPEKAVPLYDDLIRTLDVLGAEADRIGAGRRERLAELARHLQERRRRHEPARLTFICTHNSRRSQMAQILAWALAARHDLPHVQTYSAGTEATAFAPPAVTALTEAGFRFELARRGGNPTYLVRYAEDGPILRVFSKVVDHPDNPAADFCAILTCSRADASCPVVPGASCRVSLPYEDPGVFDGREGEAAAYAQRCQEIGRELAYAFVRV